MSVEYLAEKVFLQEVATAGEIWIARGPNKNIYAQEIEGHAYSLPVWSSRERLEGFLKKALLLRNYTPQAISLEVFTSQWLSARAMAIAEVQINPEGNTSRVLALTTEEFQAKLAPA